MQSTLSVFLAIGLPGAIAATIGDAEHLAPVLAADYVAAARLAGLGWLGAGQRHVVPMVLPGLVALGLELLAAALLIEVTLSFAELGVDGSGPQPRHDAARRAATGAGAAAAGGGARVPWRW